MFENDNEIIETLGPETKPKGKLKFIIIGVSVLVVVGIIVAIVLSTPKKKWG